MKAQGWWRYELERCEIELEEGDSEFDALTYRNTITFVYRITLISKSVMKTENFVEFTLWAEKANVKVKMMLVNPSKIMPLRDGIKVQV